LAVFADPFLGRTTQPEVCEQPKQIDSHAKNEETAHHGWTEFTSIHSQTDE
jgi:hypothetical protein